MLLDALLEAGHAVPHQCGGNCSCLTCHVYILQGAEHLSPVEVPEHNRLAASRVRRPESRLACQAVLAGGPVVVELAGDADEWIPSSQAAADRSAP